jgi:hypothetical protein
VKVQLQSLQPGHSNRTGGTEQKKITLFPLHFAHPLTGLLAATLGPRTTEQITAVVQATTEEHEVKKEKATGTQQKGQRSQTRPQKKEKRTFDLLKLTKFMVSPQHSMSDG